MESFKILSCNTLSNHKVGFVIEFNFFIISNIFFQFAMSLIVVPHITNMLNFAF